MENKPKKKMNYRMICRILLRNAGYMKGRQGLYIVGGILALGKLLISFLIPRLYERFMELSEAGTSLSGMLYTVGPGFLLLLLLTPLVCFGSYWQASCANLALANMKKDVFGHVLRMPLSVLESDRTDKVLRATSNVDAAMSCLTGHTMSMVFQFVICFGGGLGILLIHDWRFAVLGLLLSVLMLYTITRLNVELRALEGSALSADARLGSQLTNLSANLPMVKLLAIGPLLEKEYMDAGETAYQKRLRYKILRGVTDGILDVLSYGSQALAILLGLLLFAEGRHFPELIYISSLFSLMLSGVRELGNAVLFLQEPIANSVRVYELLDAPLEADRPDDGPAPDFTKNAAVCFEHVSFGYEPDRPVLTDLSFAAPVGAVTAIVGGSGSGKSTIFRLLEHHYTPETGRITIGGADLGHRSNNSIRACFSEIPQDAHLSDASIRENLCIDGTPRDEDFLKTCMEKAALDLPLSYIAGERGGHVSGGQAQRISIARALVKNAPIYLLDEATAALDSHTEQEILQTIHTALKGRTVICISHRLHSIRDAGQILCLDHGHIVESGTHEELLEKRGYYWRLYNQISDSRGGSEREITG